MASNNVNDVSSRSDAVLIVKLLRYAASCETLTVTRLCVVDLAGAERSKRTNTTGPRLTEASSINKDLMVVGRCLSELRWNQAHPRSAQRIPPFRDARIFMLFRDYLSGSGQTTVIANVSPRAEDAIGMLDTHRFASIANQVKVIHAIPSAVHPNSTAGARFNPNCNRSSKRLRLAEEDQLDELSGRSSANLSEGSASDLHQLISVLHAENASLQSRLEAALADRCSLEMSTVADAVTNQDLLRRWLGSHQKLPALVEFPHS